MTKVKETGNGNTFFYGGSPLWSYLTEHVDHHHHNLCWSPPGTKVAHPSPSFFLITYIFSKLLTPSPSSSPSASGAICCFSACSSLIAWVLKTFEAGLVKTWEYTIWCRKKNEEKLPRPRRPLSATSWQWWRCWRSTWRGTSSWTWSPTSSAPANKEIYYAPGFNQTNSNNRGCCLNSFRTWLVPTIIMILRATLNNKYVREAFIYVLAEFVR